MTKIQAMQETGTLLVVMEKVVEMDEVGAVEDEEVLEDLVLEAQDRGRSHNENHLVYFLGPSMIGNHNRRYCRPLVE